MKMKNFLKMITRLPLPLLFVLVSSCSFLIFQIIASHFNLRFYNSNEIIPPIYNSNENFKHVPKYRNQTKINYSYKYLPKWDFKTLVNLNDFKFLIKNSVCKRNLDLLVIVHSSPENVEKRNIIRHTWGTPRVNMKLIFMLGYADEEEQYAIVAENQKYMDIIQGNFIDHYKNNTYKFAMSFKYVVYFCPRYARYILKTEDDAFVNMPVMMEFVKNLERNNDFIFCHVQKLVRVRRAPSPWAVSPNEYPLNIYPNYCSGFAILFSYDVIFRLYREVQRGEYFWIDNIFFTGILAKRLHLNLTDFSRAYMSEKESKKFIESNGKNRKEFLFGPLNLDPKQIKNLWLALENLYLKTSPYLDGIIIHSFFSH